MSAPFLLSWCPGSKCDPCACTARATSLAKLDNPRVEFGSGGFGITLPPPAPQYSINVGHGGLCNPVLAIPFRDFLATAPTSGQTYRQHYPVGASGSSGFLVIPGTPPSTAPIPSGFSVYLGGQPLVSFVITSEMIPVYFYSGPYQSPSNIGNYESIFPVTTEPYSTSPIKMKFADYENWMFEMGLMTASGWQAILQLSASNADLSQATVWGDNFAVDLQHGIVTLFGWVYDGPTSAKYDNIFLLQGDTFSTPAYPAYHDVQTTFVHSPTLFGHI